MIVIVCTTVTVLLLFLQACKNKQQNSSIDNQIQIQQECMAATILINEYCHFISR